MTVKANQEYLTLTSVLERGWSRTMVDEFLKPADKLRPNPKRLSGSKMRLYLGSRVEDAEKTLAFIERRAKAQERASRSSKANVERMKKLHEECGKIEIEVPQIEWHDLVKAARTHYQEHWDNRGRSKSAHGDKTFTNRIVVNFLRHECSPYEDAFQHVHGKIGANTARWIIRERIYEEISKTYPQLHTECEEQMRRREEAEDEAASLGYG